MDERVHHLAARFPQAKVHLYGKGFRPGRKLGHVNVGARATADLVETRRVAQLAAHYLGAGVWADGYSAHLGSSSADSAAAVAPTVPVGPVPPPPTRERVDA
jgi:5-(carboxyamino)imidazole ribonucleotide synthase